MKKVDVLGLDYAVTDYRGATAFIIERALARKPTSVFALPVHGVVEARRSIPFKAASQNADLIVPDGQPIRWVMNWFHGVNLSDRVYGPELVKYVLEAASTEGLRIYLYGGATQEILNLFIDWVGVNYSGVKVVGSYREPVMGEYTLKVEDIEKSKADIVFCALGCPNQEIWIANSKNKLSSVLIGIGAAFSFHSGKLEQAPKWMQSSGLEWFFRLTREPRRLWLRYLQTNSYFIYLFLQESFKRVVRKFHYDI